MKTQETLQKAVQAIQNGDIDTGRRLLAQILRADPKNAQAWLWMSDVVKSEDQKGECLRRALALDPHVQEHQETSDRPVRLEHPLAGEAEPTAVQRSPAAAARAFSLPTPDRPSPAAPWAPSQDRETLFTVQGRQATAVPTLTPAQRKRGQRNILIAGAMLVLMVGGLSLLFYTVTTIVPQAQERLRPTPEVVLYTATLWCPPCQQAGSQIVLWEKVGDGVSRGGKTGELPHNTPVSVLVEEWSEPEKRRYYKVTALGQTGWVPDTFLTR